MTLQIVALELSFKSIGVLLGNRKKYTTFEYRNKLKHTHMIAVEPSIAEYDWNIIVSAD